MLEQRRFSMDRMVICQFNIEHDPVQMIFGFDQEIWPLANAPGWFYTHPFN